MGPLDNYVLLNNGDIIQSGDEFLRPDHEWRRSRQIGGLVGLNSLKYRRPVKKEFNISEDGSYSEMIIS